MDYVIIEKDSLIGTRLEKDWDFLSLISKAEKNKSNVQAELILDRVCSHYELDKLDVISPKRDADLVAARRLYSFMAYHDFASSYKDIGVTYERVGRHINRDHSSVVAQIKKIIELCSDEISVLRDIEDFCLTYFGEKCWFRVKKHLYRSGVDVDREEKPRFIKFR